MVLMVGRSHARKLEMSTINRTEQSGGSIGGDKKAGTVYIGPSWTRSIIGLELRRAPKHEQSIEFLKAYTTRNPVQRKGTTMSLVHGIM
jgi:hypothetical protein